MIPRSKVIAAALLGAAFVGGAAVGAVGSNAWKQGERRERREERPRMSYTDYLTQELGLTEVQRESLRAILARREEGMDELWREMRPRFDSLREQVRMEILGMLNETQREQYRALIARSDSARQARERREAERRRGGR